MRGIVYPYQIRIRFGGGAELLPLILCRATSSSKKSISFLGLLDSGAQITLLPKADAEELGIAIEEGEHVAVGGVGNEELFGYKHLLTLKIGGLSFKAPVVFADRNDVPRILGRESVFEKFFLILDEKGRRIAAVRRSKTAERLFDKEMFEVLASASYR